jgi:hypothetical protein
MEKETPVSQSHVHESLCLLADQMHIKIQHTLSDPDVADE